MDLDCLWNHTAEHMEEIPDRSVQLVLTSPPYNVGMPYAGVSDQRPHAEYLAMLLTVWRECRRVLVPGGRLAINVTDTGRQPYRPLHSEITHQLLDTLGLLMRGTIIWDKGMTGNATTAWGSFMQASNPVLRDVHEYVLVFCKDTFTLTPEFSRGTASGIRRRDFIRWRNSVWQIHTRSTPDHPAPFPYELAKRVILLYTNFDDIVLDPFAGTGTTLQAARNLRRHFLGYELSPTYARRIREDLAQLVFPELAPTYDFAPPPTFTTRPPAALRLPLLDGWKEETTNHAHDNGRESGPQIQDAKTD